MRSFKNHGYVAYSHGCRCEVCREAKREYERKARARRLAAGVTHGTRSGYDSGCRCDECRLARAVAYRSVSSEYKAANPRTDFILELARKTGRL